jgi:beta-aspartyl-dipeptidase (metallo-type)
LLPLETIDATGCIVVPGFVDPHAHLIGAGGEQGVSSRMPEVPFDELALGGVTTVVGCLGTDAIGRSLDALLPQGAPARSLGRDGARLHGSFQVPPPTMTGSVMRDLLLIPEVIGVGEVAIATGDRRSPRWTSWRASSRMRPSGGALAGKAGVTHFHVGPAPSRCASCTSCWIVTTSARATCDPTHVSRTPELLDGCRGAGAPGLLGRHGRDRPRALRWLPRYWAAGGPPERFTVSSDAHTPGGDSRLLPLELETCVVTEKLPLERVLPCFTSNPARCAGACRGRDGSVRGRTRDVLVLDQGPRGAGRV